MTMGGLFFPREPPPPGGGHGWLAVIAVAGIVVLTLLCWGYDGGSGS